MDKLTQLVVIGACCALSATALGAPVSLVNQGFESGLVGWSSIGDVSATSNKPVQMLTYDPFPNGTLWDVYPYQNRMAQLVSNNGVDFNPNIPALETFFDLPTGTITSIVPAAYNGSGIRQSFTGAQGDILKERWNFFSTEDSTYDYGDGTHPNDTAFVVITRGSGPGSVVLLATLADTQGVGAAGNSGWQSFDYTLPSAGDYTIGFGVVNWRDEYYDAFLFVDDGPLSAPEPFSVTLLGIGLAGLGWSRRK